ncbi:MAG: hypothetical protein JWR60_929 [Polaromonas sp.]|nr:hypothetical protein [Polaromonas sp.]
MQTPSSFARQLAAGQAIHLFLRRGARVLPVGGSARVFRQVWLAERMVSLQVQAAGDALYEAEASGWIQIEAPLHGAGVRFKVVQAPGLLQRWAARWRRLPSAALTNSA